MNYQIHSNDIFGSDVSSFWLFPIQATAVQFLRWIEYKFTDEDQLAGCILADGMGFGKTKIIAALLESHVVPTSLYICPLSTMQDAEIEFLKTSRSLNVYTIDTHVLYKLRLNRDGLIDRMEAKDFEDPFVLVINKEKLSTSRSLKIIKTRLYFRVVLDEAHTMRNGTDTALFSNLNNIEQPRTVIRGKEVKFGTRIGVTGTPINNDYDDIINIFKWIDDKLFTSTTNKMQQLRSLIRHYVFRRIDKNLTDSMKLIMEYPLYPPEIITIDITLEDTKLSRQIEGMDAERIKILCDTDSRFRQNLANDEKAFTIARTIVGEKGERTDSEMSIFSMRSILSYPFDKDVFGVKYEGIDPHGNYNPSSKILSVVEIISEYPGEAFIIFHQFEHIKNALMETFKYVFAEYHVFSITGKTPVKKRNEILSKCNELIARGEPVILLLSLRSSSEGLNCQLFCRMIFMDQDANPQIEAQAFRRIYRVGQTQLVKIWVLILETIYNSKKSIDVDRRLRDIKSEKMPSTEIVDEYNAAWYFRRYTYINQDGVRETGVRYSDKFERSNEHDSEGFEEID